MSTTKVEVLYRNRLTPTVMSDLESKLPKLGMPKSDLEAGVLIGIQMVLQKLREGYVDDSSQR